MDCHLSEEEHVASCPECRKLADSIKEGIRAFTAASLPSAPPIPARIGSYVIRQRLGQGGMGIVYEGEQQTPKRLVAVKVVRGGQYVDDYRVKLFQREVQTLARLKHPAIGSIYEAGRTEDGQHFFAMELVRGVRLNDHVRDNHIPRRARLELFRKICDAINYAHQRGVIHRDLKPSNILVDAEGNPKILDFGLARITDPDPNFQMTGTEIGKIMGTLPYMSPEEARGNPDAIDVRSDVYSLGIILYELLTDQLPYNVGKAVLHEAVRVICEDAPRKPSTIDRALRGDLDTIVLKALEKERARRYQSAASLADDLQRYLTDQPILARRSNTLYQLKKLVLRHKLVCTFAGAMLLVVALVAYSVDQLEAERRKGSERTLLLQDLAVAALEHSLGRSFQDVGKYEKAEQEYMKALRTFDRLGRYEPRYAGRTLLGLGIVLMQRENPDNLKAEELLDEAVQIFREGGRTWNTERRESLQALKALYGPEALDDAEELARVQAELNTMDEPMGTTGAESPPAE